MSARVVMLPGVVLPADLAYAGLVDALGPEVTTSVKDLELYREEQPPPAYSLDLEVAGVLRDADARGWRTFHFVGYSGGGSVGLALATKEPSRLLSLALLEPAWAGNWGWSSEHRALWATYTELARLPPEDFMPAFMRLQVLPDVPLPAPPEPPPPWMKHRPAGVRAILDAFASYDLDRDALAGFAGPVLFVLGSLSNPDQFGEMASRLGRVFSDFTVEVHEDRHHFDPPHRAEPARVAASLRALWDRADRLASAG